MRTITLVLDTDNSIINEFLDGNSEIAATAFVRKHQKFVYSVALRFLKSADDADDAAQEVFIKALNNLHKFRQASQIRTWLYRITVNVCHNLLRKRKLRSIFSDKDISEYKYFESHDPNPETQYEQQEMMSIFYKALDKLPKKQRETFALRYFDNLKYEEISQMLGTSVGGLKTNYYHAVRKLSEILGKDFAKR